MSTRKFTEERLMQVLLAPVISEKATTVADRRNQVIFKVAPNATKPEIKAAVELLFSTKEQKIEVTGVSVLNTHGKTKRAGRFIGQRQGYKKAYVSIKAGQDLNFAGQ